MPSTLVIGASRGIGHEFVRQLSSKGTDVIATARKPDAVKGLPKGVKVLQLDLLDKFSVDTAAKQVESLDTLIINAAIGNDEYLLTTSDERLTEYLNNNVLGVHRAVLAFLPALRKGTKKQIIIVSSTSGSNTKQSDLKTPAFNGPYSVTKAANNMQAVQFHRELYKDGFTVVPMHPGWVKTDMGSIVNEGQGALEVDESVAGMIKVIDALTPEKSGKFVQHDGKELPW